MHDDWLGTTTIRTSADKNTGRELRECGLVCYAGVSTVIMRHISTCSLEL